MSNKIIRTICYFSDNPISETTARIESIATTLENKGYVIQTKRVSSPIQQLAKLKTLLADGLGYANVGTISSDEAKSLASVFLTTPNLSFNVDLANEAINTKHADFLFEIINNNPSKTFDFAYTFNNPTSSPFFPSGRYERNGFAIGLQPTNLASNCNSLKDWFSEMEKAWKEITDLFAGDANFLGIDSSIAPYQTGDSSFVYFIKRLGYTFNQSTTTDVYTTITNFIKNNNPKPVGLCGLMFPCTEDIDLAQEYESGNFSIERNIYLSLHSGLGIDTYPIGIDEKAERVIEILKLMQALSNKYQKPLSVRFVSDGKAKVGDRTDFGHPHLTDCTVRAV
jgi:hypothetical protein